MIKRIFKILKISKYCFESKPNIKSWNDMSLFEQYQYARNQFQHYSIRYIYDNGDNYRRETSSEEKKYCFDMANTWDSIIKEIRLKIVAQSNQNMNTWKI